MTIDYIYRYKPSTFNHNLLQENNKIKKKPAY